MKTNNLTQERLKQLLHYSPDDGHFRWLVPKVSKVGSVAGCLTNKGYVTIKVDYEEYFAHRLAFLWVTGKWPEEYVDHINQDRSDNRWINLREATNTQNQHNTKMLSNNTSGVKGVTWDKSRNKWLASIRIDGKLKSLGRFDDIEDAAKAYNNKAKEIRGEFHNG